MDFNKRYERAAFQTYLCTTFLPDDYETRIEKIPAKQGAKITDAVVLGASKSLSLRVFEFIHESPNDPRVSLSRETFKIMRDYNCKNILAAYRSEKSDNWRLSLVTSSLEYDESRDKVLREFSNPRRNSFFLGPDAKIHTAKKMLERKGRVSDLSDIEIRFSLEVVNKDFYSSIAGLFSKLSGGTRIEGGKEISYSSLLKLPGNPVNHVLQEFAVRLIGRIVFCWFLKQKGLIPEMILSSKDLLAVHGYYHKRVEPLFFQVLNTIQKDRKPAFKIPEYDKVPFLNGGLFEPHNDDFYEYDDLSYSKHLNTLNIPDDWFKELFELLETYNFTVDENTTVDVDLSIDPEMLGRIFENLLAEINPETGESARNRTGSFYTPRPIVDYMVKKSLMEYLLGKVRHDTDDRNAIGDTIGSLLSYEEDAPVVDAETRESIIAALHEMKCLDPACGSGAFPMGILHAVALILEKLDPGAERWREKQLSKIDPLWRGSVSLPKKSVDYIHKLGIIQDCIYGVDIQPIAVEIARLRVFLSLIVDEKPGDSLPNRGIEHLPNLEFKFVCADTLIGPEDSTEDEDLPDPDHEKIKAELADLRAEYLNAIGERKNTIRSNFTRVQNRALKNYVYGWHTKARKSDLLTWSPFEDKPATWFDPFWMFGLHHFDIMIANPPYIQIQSFAGKPEQTSWEAQGYDTYARMGDVYCLFYERGYKLLREGGVLCYITSNKWMRAGYGKAMRKFFLENGSLLQVIDFGDSPIFESATTYTNITVWRKHENVRNDGSHIRVNDLSRTYKASSSLEAMLENGAHAEALFSAESFVIADRTQAKIKHRIEAIGTPLKDWDINIYRGILTGLNEAFIIDQAKYDELVADDPKSAEILKPILRGRDIKRYKAEWAGLWLIYIPWHFPLQNDSTIQGASEEAERIFKTTHAPIYQHLYKYKKMLSARNKAETGIRYEWYALQRCAATYYEEFGKEKVIFGRFMDKPTYAFDREGFFHNDALYFAAPATPYMAAVLNSKVNWFYLNQLCTDLANGFIQALLQYQVQIPIPRIPAAEQAPYNALVDAIQFARANGMNTEADVLEWAVDVLVFGLYFAPEMKAAGCYLNDHAAGLFLPARKNATPTAMRTHVTEMAALCRTNAAIKRILDSAREVEIVKAVIGESHHAEARR